MSKWQPEALQARILVIPDPIIYIFVLLLIFSAHAGQALELSKMQEQTIQIEHQKKIKVRCLSKVPLLMMHGLAKDGVRVHIDMGVSYYFGFN